MVSGISFWLWIGQDEEEKNSIYVFGETAIDLLIHMEARGFFDDPLIDLTARLKKNGISREEIAAITSSDESWEETVGKLDMEPLSTWEIVGLITEKIKSRYSQEKILEIIPDEEVLYDYSWDRYISNEPLLESRIPLLLETTIITDQEKIELRSRGPENALWDIFHAFSERSIEIADQSSELFVALRYLHLGESRKIGFNKAVLFISAISE